MCVVHSIYYLSEPFLGFLGVEKEVLDYAIYFLRYSPGITLGVIFYDSLKSFLYAQDTYTPQFII